MNEKTYLIKSTVNSILKLIVAADNKNLSLMNDIELTKFLQVSRTTIREVIVYLCAQQIIKRSGKDKIILRLPQASDYFELGKNESSKYEQIEAYFLNLIMSGELMPGDKFSEMELAKESGCTTVTVREFLNKFSSYSIIEKVPRCGWMVVELDDNLILELTAFREMVEMNSITSLLKLPQDNPIWKTLRSLLIHHQQIRDNFDDRYLEFQEVDRRFHSAIQQATKNRFTNKFFDIVLFVCHYYFLWDKNDKLERIKIAIDQHIELLSYLLSHDSVNAILTMRAHMNSTQNNLLGCAKNINTLNKATESAHLEIII